MDKVLPFTGMGGMTMFLVELLSFAKTSTARQVIDLLAPTDHQRLVGGNRLSDGGQIEPFAHGN